MSETTKDFKGFVISTIGDSTSEKRGIADSILNLIKEACKEVNGYKNYNVTANRLDKQNGVNDIYADLKETMK